MFAAPWSYIYIVALIKSLICTYHNPVQLTILRYGFYHKY